MFGVDVLQGWSSYGILLLLQMDVQQYADAASQLLDCCILEVKPASLSTLM